MMSVIHDWSGYLAEIFRVTAPGGHIQLTEISIDVTSQTGTLRADSGLKVMERVLQRYAALKHFDFQIGQKLSHLAETAGFHSVEEKIIEVPLGAWNSGQVTRYSSLIADSQSNKVGSLMGEHFVEEAGMWGRSSMIAIGVPEDVVDMYLEKIERELRDPSFRLTVKAYNHADNRINNRWYVTARKPGRSRSASPKGSHSPKRNGKSPPSSPKRG